MSEDLQQGTDLLSDSVDSASAKSMIKGKNRVKSKIVVVDKDPNVSKAIDPRHTAAASFKEEGEVIQMEINNSNAATNEFES